MNKVLPSLLLATSIISGSIISTGCAEWRSSKTVGQNIDDTAVVAAIKSKFLADKQISSKNISINCQKGVVQLSGFVNRPMMIARAENIARTVNGVKTVINNLKVMPR